MRPASLTIAAMVVSSVPAFAMEAMRVRAPTVGCYDRGLMERATGLRDDSRRADFDALLSTALDDGECRRLPAGLVVIVEDSDILAGLTKVRAQGEPQAVWVRHHALSDED